jgi:hypothetical protein
MTDHEDREHRRLDLEGELGMSRRDLLRRSAIVGGTLLWAAPVMQSLTQKAYAADGTVTGGKCAACYCYTFHNRQRGGIHVDSDQGKVDNAEDLSAQDCEAFCEGFENHAYCQGSSVASCRVANQQGNNFDSEADLLAAAVNCS